MKEKMARQIKVRILLSYLEDLLNSILLSVGILTLYWNYLAQRGQISAAADVYFHLAVGASFCVFVQCYSSHRGALKRRLYRRMMRKIESGSVTFLVGLRQLNNWQRTA